MAIDDGCKDGGQIALRFDFVQFAGFDQRREHGPVLRTCVVAHEECVLSLQRFGADCAFQSVAIHLDATVDQEQDQAIPPF